MTTGFTVESTRSRTTGWLGVACATLLASAPASANLLSLSFDGTAAPRGHLRERRLQDGRRRLGRPPLRQIRSRQCWPGNRARQVRGSGRSLNLDPQSTPQITFTAWIKGSGRGGYLLSDGGAGGLPHLFLYGGALAISGERSTIRYPDQIPAMPRDEWVFVAGVWDYTNQTMRLHQNEAHQEFSGLQMDLDPAKRMVLAETPLWNPPDNPSAKDHSVFIGGQNFQSFGQTATNMAMDDVRLFARALSAGEVDAIR